ncbi:GH25 family lysozyme [Dyella marensis]|uniref:Lyzozyme M1 (1,4-beta-N-acetylmuramidase), GH25 family n=1 Tax=Dyella marensis TaxID=500610 RepID=A0A1I1X2S3_9GAMM|nr:MULTISPECIES: GH25 family lysozyme [Dyella]SFD99640.1 Lyzozyme M1 (1,4-beta-N-acetylmuramidase), GH25 family [Dyella marensis]
MTARPGMARAMAAAWALLALLPAGPLRAQSPPAPFEGTCPSGAPAKEHYCAFFVRYNTGDGPLQAMVGDFLGVTEASQTRSVGLIIAIDDYPNLPGHNLTAAAVDARRLQDFLINDQHFDEVIVLRNADASAENINYFLEDYLPRHADDYKGSDGKSRARLLIAYSGHGRGRSPSAQPAFILSGATDPEGSDGIYKMTEFTGDVANLATHYFHVLTLINACFGANVFPSGSTGAAASPTAPGSFIITAGSPNDEVQALIPSRGSLFFDLVVNSITQGEADPQSYQYYSSNQDGSVQSAGTLTLTLALDSYLTAAFYRINAIQKKTDPAFHAISPPYFGPVQSGVAQGGFFFVANKPPGDPLASISPYLKPLAPGSPIETASIGEMPPAPGLPSRSYAFSPRPASTEATADQSVPVGPVSSIKGHPDIKIFKPPVIYPIKGYDLSSADGRIDWNAFARSPRPNFIYARALGWAGPDPTFADRWSHVKGLGIDRGAYIKFNFCLSVQDQLDQFQRLVEADPDMLPVGIELVTPSVDQSQGARQLACYQQLGAAQARERILQLAQGIKLQSRKTPILLGNSYNLSVLTDERSETYMIWLNAYGPHNAISSKLKLRGRNPWTMWQYSGTLPVPGIGAQTTGEVFFGTPLQYEAFRRGEGNVGLEAAR